MLQRVTERIAFFLVKKEVAGNEDIEWCIYLKKKTEKSIKMEFFVKMADLKKELIKDIIIVFLLINYRGVHDFLIHKLTCKYNLENTEYLLRIFIIVQWIGMIIYFLLCFLKFYKTKLEALRLLGIDDFRAVILFFCGNIHIFLMQIFFVSIFDMDFSGVNIDMVFSAIVNTWILMGILVILCQSFVFKYFKILVCFGVIVTGILICLEKLTYGFFYEILMENKLSVFLYEKYVHFTLGKLIAAIGIYVWLKHICQSRCYEIESANKKNTHLNALEDFWRKIEKGRIWVKNYRWLYRDMDFLLWKMFSFLLLFGISVANESEWVSAVAAYIICIISATYLLNSYYFEQKCMWIYYMSDFPYKNLIKGHIVGGTLSICDNVLLALLISQKPYSSIIGILVISVFFSAYVNCALYLLYPKNAAKLLLVKILIEMQIPIANFITLFQNYLKGEKNWGEMQDGKKQYFRDL